MEIHRDLIVFPGSDDKSEASRVLLTETSFLPSLYSPGNNHANDRGSQNSLREWKRQRICSHDGELIQQALFVRNSSPSKGKEN